MSLPSFLQPNLPSYDLKTLNLKRDKKLIITSILNRGDYKAMTWLGENYSKKDIAEIISQPTRGMWMKSVLSYWLKIFSLNLEKEVFDNAVINLNKF